MSTPNLLDANDFVAFVKIEEAELILCNQDLVELTVLLVKGFLIDAVFADVTIYDESSIGEQNESLPIVYHLVRRTLDDLTLIQLANARNFSKECCHLWLHFLTLVLSFQNIGVQVVWLLESLLDLFVVQIPLWQGYLVQVWLPLFKEAHDINVF